MKYAKMAEFALEHRRRYASEARTSLEGLKLYPMDHVSNVQELIDIGNELWEAYGWHKRYRKAIRKVAEGK